MKSLLLMLALNLAVFASSNAQAVVQQQTVSTIYQNQLPGFQMNFNFGDPLNVSQTQYARVWDASIGEFVLVPISNNQTAQQYSYYDQYGHLVQQQAQVVYLDQFGKPIQNQQQYYYPNGLCNQVVQPYVHPQQVVSTPINVAIPMNSVAFSQALMQVKQQSFESSKISIAKQILGSNFYTSNQVRQLMTYMNFESSRVELARFAYQRVLDPQNYFEVNNAFNFSSSVNELNNYLFGR